MKKITADQYVRGVNSIYVEQPDYDLGCDGSNGKCDCIGMGRGALKREGVTDVSGMSGTNYAARHTIIDLHKIGSEKDLRKGEVLFKVRDKDDPSMPLPDKYRKGGSDYSPTWGETNFTHYGTVTREWPNLEITHMTSPKPKKDTSLGKWLYVGRLPWVDYDASPGTEPEPIEWVRVQSSDGNPVKMRAKPSSSCRTWWKVPNGSEVILLTPGNEWSEIIWAGQRGYMMSEFLQSGEQLYIAEVRGLSLEQVQALCNTYPNATYKEMT